MSLQYVVIEFRNPYEVRVVSRHKTSSSARKSAGKRGLNTELNVLKVHTGEAPGVGETMPRTELRERLQSVPPTE